MIKVLSQIIFNKRLTKVISDPEAHLLCINAPEIVNKAKPGQFVMVKCGDKTVLRRPFGIQSIELPDKLYLLFVKHSNIELNNKGTRYGEGTEWLANQKKGTKLDIIGPLGNGFIINPDSKNLLLIAGGIGITPLVYLTRDAIDKNKSVTLILGARKAEQLYMEKIPNNEINFIVMTETKKPKNIPANSIYKKGKITVNEEFIISEAKKADQVFICGPKPMYESLNKIFTAIKNSKDIQVSLEVRMGCGIGTCYGCSIRTLKGMKKVCKDGPVFNMADIIWEELKV
jgi:dihydroorotate dehydrogenase electron transfer subunit